MTEIHTVTEPLCWKAPAENTLLSAHSHAEFEFSPGISIVMFLAPFVFT